MSKKKKHPTTKIEGIGAKEPKTETFKSSKKSPKKKEDPDSYLSQTPVWLFKFGDFEHRQWGLHREGCHEILVKLKDYEGQTWGEIIQSNSGKSKGTRNHNIGVDELVREAQKRLDEINIIEDELFSLRLASRKRVWGILRDGRLHIIWYDREHEICPSEKA